MPLADFDDLIDGVARTAAAHGAALAGGNLARSPGPLIVDVTAIGACSRRRILARHGGRAGDWLYVTGTIGAAAAGLAWLRAGGAREAPDHAARECIDRLERPEPRTRCGRIIAGSRSAHACIDLSDGLAAAAGTLAQASGTGVRIDAAAVPIHQGAVAWANGSGAEPVMFALAGGEDYELLFAVPPRRRRAFETAMRRCGGVTASCVGQLTRESGAVLARDGRQEPLPTGFRHF